MAHRPLHPRFAQRRSATLFAAALTCLAFAPAAAQAAARLATQPTFPAQVTEGATALAGSLVLANTSSAPDGSITVCNAGDGGACASSQGIALTPSCGRPADFPACAPDAADPGVFAIAATAGGAPGTACAGMLFSVTPLDPAYGSVRFTPVGGAHVQLPAGLLSLCRIDFQLSVAKMPAIDAQPAAEGVQTIPIAEAYGVSDLGGSAFARGAASTAVTVTPAPVAPAGPGGGAGDPAGPEPGGAGAGPPAAALAQPGCPVFGFTGSGGAADDRLTGGTGIDVIHGLGGRDVLRGGAGRDCLYGDDGADTLQGGAAADFLFGGAGRDRILGQAGGDRVNGEAGNDQLVGGAGADRLSGGGGADLIDARDPTPRDRRLVDQITCGAGHDVVRADARDDVASDCERVIRRR
jgi:hypothetical protein